MHVLGGTGVGKSFFLQLLIKELILAGHGVCVIDPHGDLYHDVLDFCAYAATHKDGQKLNLAARVIPFDISEKRFVLGFNPMARNARVMSYQVATMMESIRKAWGAGSFDQTPRLARWLCNLNYALIESGLTLVQARHLIDLHTTEFRPAIIERIATEKIKQEWEYISDAKPKERWEQIESCANRMNLFLMHEVIRRIFGQSTNTIDFSNVLGENKVLLVNLGLQNTIAPDQQKLIGTLFVNELLTAAFARPKGGRKPFFVFIDEFQHFVTKDICEILDGGRKFGLHLILAHQHLAQLKQDDGEVYYSVMTNARTKVVMGGLNFEDTGVLARELYAGELNPDEIKHEIWQTKFEPVESSRIVRSSSESTSSGSSDSTGQVNHVSLVNGENFIPGSGWFSNPELASTSRSQTRGSSQSSSSGNSYASSSSSGYSEVPFYEFHKFRELSSVQFRTLQEQWEIKVGQMMRQGRQHFSLLIPGKNVQLGVVRTLNQFPPEKEAKGFTQRREEFLLECSERSGCFKTPAAADAEIAELEQKLLAGKRQQILLTEEVPENPTIDLTPQAKRARGKPKTSKPKNQAIWDVADLTNKSTTDD